ncbi:voltage-dependent calcium channel subunit alpha-2/delta-4 [Grus japonensis]|uniref:Voltage-dependent calcium channel subunit alpha-2/delta-4 n=1 Tax=Grus japonensis TaxID=30415 RepID=A0ABC9VX10_GRUJA
MRNLLLHRWPAVVGSIVVFSSVSSHLPASLAPGPNGRRNDLVACLTGSGGGEQSRAAVGVQIKLELLQQKFWMAMQQILNCFLIDNNGFILVSKRPAETGKFFGAVDGSVMTQLLNMGMFRRFLLEFNMSSFWHSDNLADAHKHKKHDTLQPCDTEYPVFVYEPAIKETNGLIECGDCQKMFVAQQIASSNLLLLVTDAACDCSVFPPVLLDVKEENAQDCGGAAEVSISPMLHFLPLALLLR